MINSTPGRKSGQKGTETMDCNKTIDFFAEVKRLCNSRATCDDTAHDEQCPFFKCCNHTLKAFGAEEVEEAVEILQKWSNEHPKKTYEQDFFEKFPKAQVCSDGSPFVCRKRIYGGECPVLECDECWNKECWNEPMEDE
nr:MAG TPA: hypothetical protein [Caudoviricetes sp.]